MKDIITKILGHKNSPKESDKLIQEFIKQLMLKEGKIINLETPRDKRVSRTSTRNMKCTIGVVETIEENDSIDEQLLTMRCFEEINYYYDTNDTNDTIKDI